MKTEHLITMTRLSKAMLLFVGVVFLFQMSASPVMASLTDQCTQEPNSKEYEICTRAENIEDPNAPSDSCPPLKLGVVFGLGMGIVGNIYGNNQIGALSAITGFAVGYLVCSYSSTA